RAIRATISLWERLRRCLGAANPGHSISRPDCGDRFEFESRRQKGYPAWNSRVRPGRAKEWAVYGMKSIRVYLALLVVLAAILGALLHPLALLLALAPFDARAVVAFLVELRSLIADLLGWGVLSVLAIMAFYVLVGRRSLSRRPLPI